MQPRYIVAAGFLLAAVAGWWWIWLPIERPPDAAPADILAPPAGTAPAPPLVQLPQVGKPRAVPPVAADDPRRELATAVPEFIRLVEADDYVALVRNFSTPEEQGRLSRVVSLENLAGQISRQPEVVGGFRELAAALRRQPDAVPQLSADGAAATFPLDPPVRGKAAVTFVRVDGLWYLQN